MSEPLDWRTDGRIWPHREASRFIESGGVRWHVQVMGEGPIILLLHGTGASCHSWRDVMPELAQGFTLVVPDLPGHAFTQGGGAGLKTLPGMARALWGLLDILAMQPVLIAGHSAGAAIALQMALERGGALPVIGFNPAIMPFAGAGGQIFPIMAKLLFLNPLVPRLFSGMARLPGEAGRFLQRSTNSRIDAAGLRCYERLLGNSRHARGALAMMAGWDLDRLHARLPEVEGPVLLVHSTRDNAVPLSSVRQAAGHIARARLEIWEGPGHLAHEERPGQAAALFRDFHARLMSGASAKA